MNSLAPQFLCSDPCHQWLGARMRVRQLATTTLLAAFVSPATDRIGREVGFPIAVIGIVEDPGGYAGALSRSWHGCWRASEANRSKPFDFDNTTATSTRFRHVHFDARWMGRMPLPSVMRFSAGCLEVDLVAGVRRSKLGQVFGQAMADARFDREAERPARVRQRFATGRRLVVPCRYAASPVAGQDGRVRLVEDLYAFRPRALPSVVRALEASVRILSLCSSLPGVTLPNLGEGRHA